MEQELIHLRNEYKKAKYEIDLLKKGIVKLGEFYVSIGRVVHKHTDIITKMRDIDKMDEKIKPKTTDNQNRINMYG